MPRNTMDMETMELYKRIPTNVNKDANYLCSNCNCEYEEMRNIAARKMKMDNYERHCPSCHCPPERQRLSSSNRSRTLENVEAMLDRYVFTEPINPAVKKSQSSPLSQKVCWHDYQMSIRPRCPKRLPQTRRQRRSEHDRYLLGMCRMKGDTVNSEFANEDFKVCPMQSVPTKSSLKKHNRYKEAEGSLDDQRYSNTDSAVSINYIPHIRQLKKPYASNLESRRHYIGRDNEYVTEMKIESDVDHQQNEHECQEMREPGLIIENVGKQKCHQAAILSEDNERNEKRKFDVGKAMKPTMSGDDSHSALVKQSFDKSARKIAPDGSAHLAKLDLYSTKNHILESIDHMLGNMDDAKKSATQQEQTDQEIVEKVTREFLENGWQLLFNALTIHRNSTISDKRTVRLECLNHIRQELVKLYALESILNNCPSKQQSLSSHDMPCNEEQQQSHQPLPNLDQKIADS